jgi:NADH-quinone oxidoreductase subunit J
MLFIMAGLGTLLLVSGLNSTNSFTAPAVDFVQIGEQMLTYYSPVLIVLGLVLAGSVIAALALSRREDVEKKEEEQQK